MVDRWMVCVMTKMIAHTSVYHGDTGYIVSTVDRESSVPMGGRYAETIVWDINRNEILHMDSAAPMSIETHLTVVRLIQKEGAYWKEEE